MKRGGGKTKGKRPGAPANPLGAASGDAVLRAPEGHHAVKSYLVGWCHHALGACESVSVGAKMGSSSVVDTHQRRDNFGFGLVFRCSSDGKPVICGHAARFARVEGEVRKIQKPKIFGRKDFLEGEPKCKMQMRESIHGGVLGPPTLPRTSSPSLAVLRNIVAL